MFDCSINGDPAHPDKITYRQPHSQTVHGLRDGDNQQPKDGDEQV